MIKPLVPHNTVFRRDKYQPKVLEYYVESRTSMSYEEESSELFRHTAEFEANTNPDPATVPSGIGPDDGASDDLAGADNTDIDRSDNSSDDDNDDDNEDDSDHPPKTRRAARPNADLMEETGEERAR